ncbi:hypothetical protein [Ferrimonas gelatinilytica]|uniref:DNA repair ATPase n=1 Tax=Ferrimonas gelatinilytica TaxID=1255257 RepID=A0ABP9S3M3_9GAMM
MSDLIKRLRLIETCISLQDHSLIELQLPLLKSLSSDDRVSAIASLLEQNEYLQAQQEIESWLRTQSALVKFEDTQTNAIRLELKLLEQKLESAVLKRNEAQNRLQDFNREYHLRLGALLLRILSLQEEIAAQELSQKLKHYRQLHVECCGLRDMIKQHREELRQLEVQLDEVDFLSPEYDKLFAQYQTLKRNIDRQDEKLESVRQHLLKELQKVKQDNAYEDFQQAHDSADRLEQENEEIKESVVAQLSKEEAKLLKATYRKASKLCHPDVVCEELKAQAHDLMVQVNEAYAAQDLGRLQDLLRHIESGGEFAFASDTLTSHDSLLEKLNELKARYQQIEEELRSLEQSDEYETVTQLGDDWSDYFDIRQRDLEALAQELEQTLAALMNEGDETDFEDRTEANYESSCRASHEVTGFWRQGHWREGSWVRGHWVKSHTRGH